MGTHEFWSANGERFYYCSNPHGIYGVDLASGDIVTVLENVDPWHAHASKNEKYIVFSTSELGGCDLAITLVDALIERTK